MGQDFDGKVCFGQGGGWYELISHVVRELMVEGIGIGQGEEDSLEQIS